MRVQKIILFTKMCYSVLSKSKRCSYMYISGSIIGVVPIADQIRENRSKRLWRKDMSSESHIGNVGGW